MTRHDHHSHHPGGEERRQSERGLPLSLPLRQSLSSCPRWKKTSSPGEVERTKNSRGWEDRRTSSSFNIDSDCGHQKHQKMTIIMATPFLLFTFFLSSLLASSLPFAIKTFDHLHHLHSKTTTINGHIKHLERHLWNISSSWGITNISNISCIGSSCRNMSSSIKSIICKMSPPAEATTFSLWTSPSVSRNHQCRLSRWHRLQSRSSHQRRHQHLCQHQWHLSSQRMSAPRMMHQPRYISSTRSSMRRCRLVWLIHLLHRHQWSRSTLPSEPSSTRASTSQQRWKSITPRSCSTFIVVPASWGAQHLGTSVVMRIPSQFSSWWVHQHMSTGFEQEMWSSKGCRRHRHCSSASSPVPESHLSHQLCHRGARSHEDHQQGVEAPIEHLDTSQTQPCSIDSSADPHALQPAITWSSGSWKYGNTVSWHLIIGHDSVNTPGAYLQKPPMPSSARTSLQSIIFWITHPSVALDIWAWHQPSICSTIRTSLARLRGSSGGSIPPTSTSPREPRGQLHHLRSISHHGRAIMQLHQWAHHSTRMAASTSTSSMARHHSSECIWSSWSTASKLTWSSAIEWPSEHPTSMFVITTTEALHLHWHHFSQHLLGHRFWHHLAIIYWAINFGISIAITSWSGEPTSIACLQHWASVLDIFEAYIKVIGWRKLSGEQPSWHQGRMWKLASASDVKIASSILHRNCRIGGSRLPIKKRGPPARALHHHYCDLTRTHHHQEPSLRGEKIIIKKGWQDMTIIVITQEDRRGDNQRNVDRPRAGTQRHRQKQWQQWHHSSITSGYCHFTCCHILRNGNPVCPGTNWVCPGTIQGTKSGIKNRCVKIYAFCWLASRGWACRPNIKYYSQRL